MDLSINASTVYRMCGDVILYVAWAFIIVLCAIVTVNKRNTYKRNDDAHNLLHRCPRRF